MHVTALATPPLESLLVSPPDMEASHHMLSPNLKTDVHVPHSQLGDHMPPFGQKMGNPEAQTDAIRVL